jgi:hypothetical protein
MVAERCSSASDRAGPRCLPECCSRSTGCFAGPSACTSFRTTRVGVAASRVLLFSGRARGLLRAGRRALRALAGLPLRNRCRARQSPQGAPRESTGSCERDRAGRGERPVTPLRGPARARRPRGPRGRPADGPVPLDLDRPAGTHVHEPGGDPVVAAVGAADDRRLVELHRGDENLSHLAAAPSPGAQQEHVVHPECLDAKAHAEVTVGDHVEVGPPPRRHLVERRAPRPPRCERPVKPDIGTGEMAPVTGTSRHGNPLTALTRAQ